MTYHALRIFEADFQAVHREPESARPHSPPPPRPTQMTVLVNLRIPASLVPKLKLPLHANATASGSSDGWAEVVVPLGAAWVVGIAWLLCSAWVRKQCKRREKWQAVDDFGLPLWRCATGMWTQLLVLPSLFALSLAWANFSVDGWADTAGAAWFTENGKRFWDWCFCYVFAGYMIEDLVLLRIGPLMMLHHVGCLVGLLFAFVAQLVESGADPLS